LVPSWAQHPGKGDGLINARAETADKLPAFRHAFRQRRCLIPADGFFEWRRTAGKRQPYHFHLSGDRPFAFAGLWERWHGDDGAALESCCLLTTAANSVVRPVHERMPVLLDAGDFGAWLDPTATVKELKVLLRPYAGDDLQAVAVSTWVNNAKHEGPRCLEPANEQPGLRDAKE
jgi:putative SOS response-associated peptidase YedK